MLRMFLSSVILLLVAIVVVVGFRQRHLLFMELNACEKLLIFELKSYYP
jgi:hypothetical protein